MTALAVVLPGSAAAADEECLAHVMTEAKMAVGRPGTVTQSVSLPAGDVRMAVHTWDGYPERVDAVQPHERVEIMLLSGGAVVLSSGITPDLADLVENASWNGSFSAPVPSGVDTVVIQHRPGDTGSPDSLWAEVTVCVEEPEPTTTTTTTATTTTTTEANTTTTEATTTTTEATTTSTTEVSPITAVATTVPTETTAPPDTGGVKSEETGVTTTAPAPLQQLPRTGATTNTLAVVGIALIGVGGSLMLITRRQEAA